MNKELVYIPTKIVDERFYHTKEFCLDSYGSKRLMNYLGNGEWVGEGGVTDNITHWLKPREAYVFTTEELKQLLSDVFDAGKYEDYKDISFDGGENYETIRIVKDKQEYIENLLNKEK